MKKKLPELLLPAGNLEKLKVAVLYGADAVYLSGQKFGLRAAADNFTENELAEGISFAHQNGALVYLTLNGFLHDKDLEELPSFIKLVDNLGIDAFIISDIGVINTVSKISNRPIHLSTQASSLNTKSVEFWKKQGVTRVILGREVTILEAKKILDEVDIEIEMFVHGSLCMAYSGHCVISNYTQGRDSNRGGCAHSCRFEYSLELENDLNKHTTFFMSSKDLSGIRVIPELVEAGITSLKIEGRMKGPMYAGTCAKVYREALDAYEQDGSLNLDLINRLEGELEKMPHRDYTEKPLVGGIGAESTYDERQNELGPDSSVAGLVVESKSNKYTVVEVKNAFNIGDSLELVPFKGPVKKIKVDWLTTLTGAEINRTKPSTLVKIPFIENSHYPNFLRKVEN